MVVLIAMLTGISDVAALIGIFGANAAMILFGLLMERQDREGDVDWLPYWLGLPGRRGPVDRDRGLPLRRATQAPGFVYAIFVSLFVLFNCFAVNMALHFRRVGPVARLPSSASGPTSSRAWSRSRPSPGRCSPARSSPEARHGPRR